MTAEEKSKVQKLSAAAKRMMRFTTHLMGCAIDQTDFCTCGKDQACKETAEAAINALDS